MISVCYFSNALARGGAEEHVLTLLHGLDRSRFRASLVCTPEVAAKVQPDVPDDVDVTPLRLRRLRDVGGAVALARLLRSRRIDVLHSHLFYSSLFASPIGRLCRVPLVVETPHVRERWRRGLKASYLVDRLAGRCVDRYIAVSEANRRYLVEEKRLPARKIGVIHNGADLARFTPDHRAPAGFRERLGFGASDPVLVVVGRLEPQKGHAVLLDAMPAIFREFPATRLVCVGEGDLRAELEEKADQVSFRDAVRFVGRQPNVEDWLALADVVVLPSFYEGLPLAAIEALAAGRAMVATAVDGTPEVVVDGATGLTVPPGDPARLARTVCRLLGDARLRERLGRAGRAWVLERFDQAQQVQRTEALYQLALARRGHAAAVQAPDLAPTGSRR